MNVFNEPKLMKDRPTDSGVNTRTYDARQIVGEKSEAKIVLDDQIYVLRITKQNKLILTK